MRIKIAVYIAFISISLFVFGTLAQAQRVSKEAQSRSIEQDGRKIERLEWVSPDNCIPGTYREYLERHPLKAARFSECLLSSNSVRKPATNGLGVHPYLPHLHIAILVDETLYPQIEISLNRYVRDLVDEGCYVIVHTVTGGSPEEIKNWITTQYNDGFSGFVMVGDITAAWAEISGSQFPSDLYYMDLDGYWEDSNHDGIFDVHEPGAGDVAPDVYVARINAHTLDYNTEAAMTNGYFSKVRAYRAGTLTQPWRGLEYVDEDWYSMDVHLDLIYDREIERFDSGYFTVAQDYLDQMEIGRHFVQVCAHSYSQGHHFGMRPTESVAYAHVYVYSPDSRLVNIWLGADDGLKVWMNGNQVCVHDYYVGYKSYVHATYLQEGWNRMLCKVSQEGGDFLLSARFTGLNGQVMNDLEYRTSNPAVYPAPGEFIMNWLVNGFHQDVQGNFWSYLTTNYLGDPENQVNPTEGQQQGGKTWTAYPSPAPYIDLDAYGNQADYGVTYAFSRIYADTNKPCQLWLGYDDGVMVWLNGSIILTDNRKGSFEPDMKKLYISLRAGENRLLVKVSEFTGSHGFSARFCGENGTRVEGLTYDPAPAPIVSVGSWLLNGVYYNPDQGTRLHVDYLGNEVGVEPSEGDPAAYGTWETDFGSDPFDLVTHFDQDGGWVFSNDIQNADPPVLFYNLFACGPGRFTDNNYLAGAYIFNTTHGLITVASSKSGSMLNFQDFTKPLGNGETLGKAFLKWFEAQAPYELWEREWYYGMILNGDPLLRIHK